MGERTALINLHLRPGLVPIIGINLKSYVVLQKPLLFTFQINFFSSGAKSGTIVQMDGHLERQCHEMHFYHQALKDENGIYARYTGNGWI